jgi:hypothetical protein
MTLQHDMRAHEAADIATGGGYINPARPAE